jgi:hypothetical protein
VFLALAAFKRRGHTVGYRIDEDEDWPVVYAETPVGQIAWHVPREELPDWLDRNELEYDGHTTEEKHERVQAFAQYLADQSA